MTFEYSSFVRCTKEEAWELISNIERRPEWIHFQEKCFWLDKKPGFIGSTYQEVEVFLGFHINVKYEVTAWEPYRKMTSHTKMPPFHQTVEVYMEERVDGCYTRLVIHADMGILGLIPKFIIKNKVNELVNPMVDIFVELLEKNSVLRNK